ncbi:RHS repeat-associated core domain-containing protein [Streptomyces sp. HPF1205]|uniref:RHS repeat-associated core domain-containing protein n=1 Tax=Streptomyces sp. HPF1205 TaxID=2873262 RepID=UPI0027DF5ADC|nr:RHS repeat-associated core domain-containing protein [Streptomyces sp. HPF1205]
MLRRRPGTSGRDPGRHAGRRARLRALALTALGTAGVHIAALCPATASAAPSAGAFHPIHPQSEHVVAPGGPAAPVPYTADPAAAHSLRAAPRHRAFPAAAPAVTVDVPSAGGTAARGAGTATGALVRVGGLPVKVGAATGRPAAATAGAPRTAAGSTASGPAASAAVPVTRASVAVVDRRRAPAAWRNALLLRVGRADEASAPGRLRLAVDYSGFSDAFGADWASRLRLVALPPCALITPLAAACRGTALDSRDDPAAHTVSGDVTVPAQGGGTTAQDTALLAVTSGPSGAAGSYAATPLSPSASWTAGGSSGDFTWSYPMRVPPSLGGPRPDIALDYSSQSVDGEMASSNNQPSVVGEGFQLATGGAITRGYKACADDMGADADNTVKTGDECWATDNATLSLKGQTSELVKDDATGSWHLRSDDGSRVEHLTGAANGDDDGEYWKVTTADGTQYWFGLNHLPGWASGRPATNSAWTVPVYGNNPGEPCHGAGFDSSWCRQAWQWNLDYVVDPHGNSMSLWYATEDNSYARDLDSSKTTAYTRAGHLTEIDYGTRTGSEFGTAPARVTLTMADRCLPGTACDSAHPADWPDVPWDQSCATASCTQYAPTFFTTKRLSRITTQVWNPSASAYRDVEAWTLTQAYPDPGDGTRAGLWLSAIGHTGLDGMTTTVPDITFTGVQMANRVDAIDASPAMNWWRLASVRDETGGETSVQYSAPDCVAGSRMPAAPESNTLRCYPVIWAPPGASAPITDWFHKYVVTAVAETDHTGGAPRVLTSYDYQGTPAWHYTDDDGLVTDRYKTWSQWRGYGTVRVTKGDAGEQTLVETRYFRGMDGDHLPSGTRSASVPDTRGGTFTDSDAYAGVERQQITYNGPGGAEISDTLTDPWMSAPTATRTQAGVSVTARHVATAATSTRTALDGGRGWRTTKTATAYDSQGMPVQADDYGDAGDSGDDQCTLTTYVRNTSAWIMNLASRVQVHAGDCAHTPTSGSQIISDTRDSYDGNPPGTAPAKGDLTRIDSLKDWSAGTTSYLTTTTSAYDADGRVTDTADVDGNHTLTAYTPASGGPVTGTTSTNPMGWTTTTDLDPAWGTVTGVTDPNGRRTDLALDGLGRTTAVWLPGRAKASQSATTTYAYRLSTTAPDVVSTSTLNPNGGYTTGYTFYDGLLRPRQTQAPAVGPAGGAQVTDTFYDTAGRAYKANAAYIIAAAPGSTLFNPTGDNAIPSQTLTLFDGAGRTTASVLRSLGAEKWRTTTAYGGDHTDTVPPPGGQATSTLTDARGRTVALRSFHGGTATGAYDTTSYTFDARGLPATVTDAAGATWSYGYDIRERRTVFTDPDKGTTTTAYDDAGRVLTTTDARGETLAYTYDKLSRKTAEYEGTTSGTKLAEWTYDTLAKGKPTASTAYSGGNAYTTAVKGYTASYQPTGSTVTVPAAEGALAGSYTFGSTYKADGTTLSTTTLPAAGGLPMETLGYTYADTGQPLTLTGDTSYVTDAEYTRFGEPSVLTYSTGGPLAQSGLYYDEATRRLTRTLDIRQTAPSTLADVSLARNPAGDVTEIADTPAGGAADTQCLGYDAERRLTSAWTPADGDCATAPSTAALGGPAPYWQSYGYDTVGDRTSLTVHATTAGAAATTTGYTYPAAGAAQPHTLLSSATTGPAGTTTARYTYDAGGNTTGRPGTAAGTQSLTWNAQGRTATVTDPGSGTSTYVYDADGNRLLTHDPAGTTLYLPGEELHLATGSASPTATRYLTFGGTSIGQRTAQGVTWLMPDHQGTATLAVAAAGTQAATERRQDPFGRSRGTAPAWPNQHGFVGGTDEADGLVHLGARDYDPAAGRFTSPDPVFDSTKPLQLLNYAYAADSPVTGSDPSGKYPTCPDCEPVHRFTPPPPPKTAPPKTPPPAPSDPTVNVPVPDSQCQGWAGWTGCTQNFLTASWLSAGYVCKEESDAGQPCTHFNLQFGQDSAFTAELRQHAWLDKVRQQISGRAETCLADKPEDACKLVSIDDPKSKDTSYYNADNLQPAWLQVAQDACTYISAGSGCGETHTAAFLGSFNVHWQITGYDSGGSAQVAFTVTNDTTVASLLRYPGGNPPGYIKTGLQTLQARVEDVTHLPTMTETFTWNETVPVTKP